MYVTTVASDHPWAGAVELAWEDDWDEFTLGRLVEELDGVERTALVFSGPTGDHLAIGGSTDAGLIVYVSYDDVTFALAEGRAVQGSLEVVAGGTLQDYPMRYVLEPEIAVRAAWEFIRTGELDEGLTWERTG